MSLPLITVHRIDADRRLCYVNEGFRQAAIEGGDPDLPDRAIGTPLLDHFSGEPVKQWYRLLLDHVAQQGVASFEYRCDTPTMQRLLRMDIQLQNDGSIEFASVTLSTSPRPYAKILDRSIPHSSRQIFMCSLCLRVQTMIGWLDVSQAAHVLQIFNDPIVPSIEYTVCKDDRTRLSELLKQRIDE